MRVLITGINGVVGGNLAAILGANPTAWHIEGLGSSATSAHEPYHHVNLTDKNVIDKSASALGAFDMVIHCAAIIDMKYDPAAMMATNVIGTLNALHLAKQIGAKQFINISGSTVIGKILALPITELHPCAPTTMYHLSKLHAEQAAALYPADGMQVISLRIPSPVGLNMPPRNLLPILLDRALKNETIQISGSKTRRQNFLDLRDLAKAIITISNHSNISGVYNIAAASPISNLGLARIIVDCTKSQSAIIDMTEEGSDIEDWDIDTSKAKADFGFEARYDITQTLDWVISEAAK